MPMRWHGYCRFPGALRQLLEGRRALSSQAQSRSIAQFQTIRGRHDRRLLFNDLGGVRSSRVVTAGNHNGRSESIALITTQSNFKWPLGLAITSHAQHDLQPGAFSMPTDHEAKSEVTRSSTADTASQPKRNQFKFAKQERGKENRLLVNQLLKDKGRLSYDWRVPVQLLEHHHDFTNTQPPNTDVRLFRNVAQTEVKASEHEGSRLIQRINTRNPNEAKLARDITTPTVWSTTALADYVEDLVEYEYHKDAISLEAQLPNKGSSNVGDITTALNGIFFSPTTKHCLSIHVYRIALRFFYDHGLFSKARAIYLQMEDSRMTIPTDIFNLVLRGSASSKDLHSFTFILQKCIQRGLKPNIETWNTLLTTISSSEVRAVIIQRMRERGILDSLSGQGNSLRHIVQHEVGSHIDEHGDRGAFLDHMDDHYGTAWLTTSTGNKLLYEYGKRRSMSETLNLLPGLRLRGWRPDEVSLDTLLRQSLLLKQHKYAISILDSFEHHFRVKPGKQAHETLFLLAWRSHLLNFTRVVWTFARTYGYDTSKMRNHVFQSLLSSTAVEPSDGNSERFKKLVGAFVVGVNQSKEMVPLGRGGISEGQRPVPHQSVVKNAQILLQSELLASGSRRIQEDLGRLLSQALELDMEWAATKCLSTANLQQVLQNGIRIRQAVSYSQRRRLRRKVATSNIKASKSVPKTIAGPKKANPSARRSTGNVRVEPVKRKRPSRRKPRPLIRQIILGDAFKRVAIDPCLEVATSNIKASKSVPKTIAGPKKENPSARRSTGNVRVEFVKRKRPSRRKPRPLIRQIILGDAFKRVAIDPCLEMPTLPPASQKPLYNLVRKKPTSRLHIAKDWALREEPVPRSPRPSTPEHSDEVYKKHTVIAGVGQAPVRSSIGRLPEHLETAHIHSSLDELLGLNDALDEGAKLNKGKAVGDETTSFQAPGADQRASSPRKAASTMRFRRRLSEGSRYIYKEERRDLKYVKRLDIGELETEI
jgi:hypothetical protein